MTRFNWRDSIWVILSEIFLLYQSGLAQFIDNDKDFNGFMPFTSVTSTDFVKTEDDFLLPFLSPSYYSPSIQHDSYTLSPVIRADKVLPTQPYTNLEFVKLIEPSFLPDASVLSSLASNVSASKFYQTLELGNSVFTMDSQYIPFGLYSMADDSESIKITDWQSTSFDVASLPQYLKDQLLNSINLGSWQRTISSGNGSVFNQIITNLETQDGTWTIYEFINQSTGTNYFMAVSMNSNEIVSFLMTEKDGDKSPLYVFKRDSFSRDNTLEVSNGGSYHMTVSSIDTENVSSTEFSYQKLFDFYVDNIVVTDRNTDNTIAKFNYRLKAEGEISLNGKKVPVNGVVEYRDVCLDSIFSTPISYRETGYQDGDISLQFASYKRILSNNETLFVDFPIDGIEVSEDKVKAINYVMNIDGWSVICSLSDFDVSLEEIEKLSKQDLKNMFLSSNSSIIIINENGSEVYKFHINGEGATLSKQFSEASTNSSIMADYVIKDRSICALDDIFGTNFSVSSFLDGLNQNLSNFEQSHFWQKTRNITESTDTVTISERTVDIDFANNMTSIMEEETILDKNTDNYSSIATGTTYESYSDMRIISISRNIRKFSQTPSLDANGNFSYESLDYNNIVWNSIIEGDSSNINGVLIDYSNGKPKVEVLKGEANNSMLQFKRYDCDIEKIQLNNDTASIVNYVRGHECIAAGVYNISADMGFQKLWEITKEADGSFGYYMLPITNFQKGAPHLYNLLTYTGQLEEFIEKGEVEIDLVNVLNEKASSVNAGSDRSNSFIKQLNSFWMNYRSLLFAEMSVLGVDYVDGKDGSEDSGFVLEIKMQEGALQNLRQKKQIYVYSEDASTETNLFIDEMSPQLDKIAERVVFTLDEGEKLPEDNFDFLYQYYLAHSGMSGRVDINYVIENGYEQVFVGEDDLRMIVKVKDGHVVGIRYPNPEENKNYYTFGTVMSMASLDSLFESSSDSGNDLIYNNDGSGLSITNPYWEEKTGDAAGQWAGAKLKAYLKGVEGLLGDFLGKYSDLSQALEEGKIVQNAGRWEISLGEEGLDHLVVMKGFLFLQKSDGTIISYQKMGGKVNIAVYGSGGEIFKTNTVDFNESMLSRGVYKFLTADIPADDFLFALKTILSDFKKYLDNPPGGVGIAPFPGYQILKYPNEGYFRISGTNNGASSVVDDKFFSKVENFNYYYNLARVADQINKGENNWIILPRKNITDILLQYPLGAFNWLNDLIIGQTGGSTGGHIAASFDISKLYTVDPIILYDKATGFGNLTYQNYRMSEFEFGTENVLSLYGTDGQAAVDREGFNNWVENLLVKLLPENADEKQEVFDTLWSVYQLAKEKKNMGLFYYYCRGAFLYNGSVNGDYNEYEKLRIAAEVNPNLEKVYNMLGKDATLNELGFDYSNKWHDYFKYLTFPDFGDNWEPMASQIVLKPNRLDLTWELIAGITATAAIFVLDRTGFLSLALNSMKSALAPYGLNSLATVLGWATQVMVGAARGAGIFTFVYNLPMMLGQNGNIDWVNWFNNLGQSYMTGFVYSLLFGVLFTPAQLGIGDMPPLIGLLGKPATKLLEGIGSKVGGTAGKIFTGTARGINGLLTYGNALEAAMIGTRTLADGSKQVLAQMHNWRYVLYFYPTEVVAEEIVIPPAIEMMSRGASSTLLYSERPMTKTLRSLALANLRNTETYGSMAEMTDPLENPLGFAIIPGILGVLQEYGIRKALGLQIPTN